MTLTVDDRELIEDMAKAIFDAFCSGVHSPMAREQYARQRRYKEAARAALQTPRLQSLLSDRDKLTEDYLFAKRQWHQESERAERLENELAPLRKLRDDPSWEVVRAALRSTDNG